MQWLDSKYINLLSNTLDKFNRKDSNLYNFRCPFCLDSKANKNKSRGYLFNKSGKYIFFCHNCNKSLSFDKFLFQINPSLHQEYSFDKFNQQSVIEPPKPVIKQYTKVTALDQLIKVSQLNSSHPCKKYVVSRQIPSTFHHRLFYCDKFKQWINQIVKDKFTDGNDSPRLVIPIFNYNKQLIGVQGRSLVPDDKVRYITVIFDDSSSRLFGADIVDQSKRFYVFEGPIDSMFIANSVATCGGKITSELKDANRDNCVIVYDNEPRNKQIVDQLLSAAREGYTVCVWPQQFKFKDVNQFILSKVSGDYCKTELVAKASAIVKQMIDDNSFSGLQAELMITQWRK